MTTKNFPRLDTLPGDWHVRGPVTLTTDKFIPPLQISLAEVERTHDALVDCGLRVTSSGLVPEGEQFAGWWRVSGTDVPAPADAPPVVAHYDGAAVAASRAAWIKAHGDEAAHEATRVPVETPVAFKLESIDTRFGKATRVWLYYPMGAGEKSTTWSVGPHCDDRTFTSAASARRVVRATFGDITERSAKPDTTAKAAATKETFMPGTAPAALDAPIDITLKNVKHAAFASQDTHCFSADIYIGGKREGSARNTGHGGATHIEPHRLAEKLDTYAATLPRVTSTMADETDPTGFLTYAQTGETLIEHLLEKHLLEKEVKRAMSRRILFTVAGKPGIFETKPVKADVLKTWLAMPDLATKLKAAKVLNLLPLAEAVALYTGSAKG